MLVDSPFLGDCQHLKLAVSILLRLDHIGTRISDLLVQLDLLLTRGAFLGLGCLQCGNLGLVGRGYLVLLIAYQACALPAVLFLRDQPRLLNGIQLLLGVRVVGLDFLEGILSGVEGSEVDCAGRSFGCFLVFEARIDIRDVLVDDALI